MNWRGGIKRDKYDALFSELVRERADWVCEFCRRNYRFDHHGLHCSHLFGRAKQSVRLHPENAFAHCMRCHDNLGQHPVDFAEWARVQLGEQRYLKLQYLASKPTKFTKADREAMHKHYLAEKKRLLAMRKAGVMGRIEFTMPGQQQVAA